MKTAKALALVAACVLKEVIRRAESRIKLHQDDAWDFDHQGCSWCMEWRDWIAWAKSETKKLNKAGMLADGRSASKSRRPIESPTHFALRIGSLRGRFRRGVYIPAREVEKRDAKLRGKKP